jgi:single-strand DNA-binding protein
MNPLRNRVQLIGNIGQDPEIKTLESGKKVAHFTLATNDSYKNAEGMKVDEVTWHNLVAWNGTAEIASKFLKKGKEICVEGRITYRTYTDKTGNIKNITEITVTDLLLLRSAKEKE